MTPAYVDQAIVVPGKKGDRSISRSFGIKGDRSTFISVYENGDYLRSRSTTVPTYTLYFHVPRWKALDL